ncbi:MAG: hypothetical protein ACLP1D_07045, partial [Xanthobacteraceae bacterium]
CATAEPIPKIAAVARPATASTKDRNMAASPGSQHKTPSRVSGEARPSIVNIRFKSPQPCNCHSQALAGNAEVGGK